MADNKNGIDNTAENVSSGKRLPPAAARAKKAAEERAKALEQENAPVEEPVKTEPEVIELPKIDEPVEVTDPIPAEELTEEQPVQVLEPTEIPVSEETTEVVATEETPVEETPVEEPAVEEPKIKKGKKVKEIDTQTVNVTFENGKVKKIKRPNKSLTKVERKMKKIIKKGKRKYWWRYLLLFLFGFIFFPIALAGGAIILTTQVKTKDLVSLFGGNPEDVLTEKYHDKTVFELVMSFANGEITFNSIGGIREITPYVDELVNMINTELDKAIGFTFDIEELYKVTFDEIGDYIYTSLTDGIELAKILNITESSSRALIYLGYETLPDGSPDWNNPRSLGDLMTGMNEIIENAPLGALIDVGTEGILYNLRDVKVNELADVMNTKPLNEIITIGEDALPALKYMGQYSISELEEAFENATLGDLLDVGTEGILYNLRDVKVSNLADEMNNRPLNQIIDISSDDFPALVYMGQFAVNELSEGLENATLGDLIEIDPDSMLWELKDCKLDELSDEILDLKLGDVMEIDETSNSILQYLKDTSIRGLNDAINDLPIDVAIEINEDSPKFLKSLAAQGVTVSTIGDMVKDLTLADMIDVGDSKILQAIADSTFETLPSDIDALTISDIIDVGTSRILNAIANSTFDSLSSDIENLTLSDVVDTDSADAPLILKSLAGVKINELGNAIHDLQIEEIIEIKEDSPMILKALKGTKFEELATRIETLAIQDIFTEAEIADNIFLKAMGGTTRLEDMAARIGELTFVEVFKEQIYENPDDPTTLKSTWKYLLTDEHGVVREDYKLAHDMSKLIDNMQRNFQKATLYELNADGFIPLSDSSILNKSILGQKIGDLTMEQLINLVAAFAS